MNKEILKLLKKMNCLLFGLGMISSIGMMSGLVAMYYTHIISLFEYTAMGFIGIIGSLVFFVALGIVNKKIDMLLRGGEK